MDVRDTCFFYEREFESTEETWTVSAINNPIIQDLYVVVPHDAPQDTTFTITIGGQTMFTTNCHSQEFEKTCLFLTNSSRELVKRTDSSIAVNMLAFNEGFFPCVATMFHALKIHVNLSNYKIKISGWEPFDFKLTTDFFRGRKVFPMLGWGQDSEESWTTFTKDLSWYQKKNLKIIGFVFQIIEGDVSNVSRIHYNNVMSFDIHGLYNEQLGGFDLPALTGEDGKCVILGRVEYKQRLPFPKGRKEFRILFQTTKKMFRSRPLPCTLLRNKEQPRLCRQVLIDHQDRHPR